MVTIHGTQRFRDRVPGVSVGSDEGSPTWLGPWYASLLRWRSPVALFVNEATLLPVLVRLAPARTLLSRFPAAVADVLTAHRVPRNLIDTAAAELATVRLASTANRSVVGVMNEFGHLADAYRDTDQPCLLDLSVRLASTPCGPLYQRHVSPDRELAALIDRHTRTPS